MRTVLLYAASLCVVALLLLPVGISAQSNDKPAQAVSESDQTLREILNELRLLRAELVRVSVNAQRSQVLLDRIRLQQAKVVRLNREISDAREKLSEVRGQEVRVKAGLDEAEKRKETGLASDDIVKEISANLAALEQREQSLVDRESHTTTELASAQGELDELNTRLDLLEQEMAQPTSGEAGKPAKRPQ